MDVTRWVYTDRYGWMWASNEPFGWATYHYGRWGFSKRIGWFWVPVSRWAPAWVSWRQPDHYLAWAPLPPSYDEGASVDATARNETWCYGFCAEKGSTAEQCSIAQMGGDSGGPLVAYRRDGDSLILFDNGLRYRSAVRPWALIVQIGQAFVAIPSTQLQTVLGEHLRLRRGPSALDPPDDLTG